ncbi:MAG TPA: hypothetical protein VE954_17960 [Oligoflexus sp.]|uniref:hypothetical protein n=1 Tax=Oligoflexus sp. TaxID=1971216 RepID=UPI002D391AEF|nr:hypothetical protein [Oligoflexus sp.]HYX34985.1 hypothetical protein [Oligoflexus sp.]
MSLKKRDDHYIPQCLLRMRGLVNSKVCYTKWFDTDLELECHSVEEKIHAFYRASHDTFFNAETMKIDDLNKYRSKFENRIKKDVCHVLKVGTDHRLRLEKDHEYASRFFSASQKLKWIKFYYLSILMTPLLQIHFERWYRILYSQVHGEHSLSELLRQASGLRISPSTMVSEKFNNWVLDQYNEIFISFMIPNNEEEYFLASDCYIPRQYLEGLMEGIRLPWIPLHPKLLLRVFFQRVQSQQKEQLQLRYFYEPASIMNVEALKHGSEILGAESHKSLIAENLYLIKENKYAI